MELAIETIRVTGGYGNTMVLRELSLRIERGSIYGFLGPNGAGKTTAMRMFLGLLRPISGETRLFGQRVPDALPGILARVGALIEQPSVYDHLTGFENLEIHRKLRGLPPAATHRAIEVVEAGPFVDRRVKEYSRGMRQRGGVAIAILGIPNCCCWTSP